MARKSAEVSGLTRAFSFEFVDEDKSYKFQTNVAIPSDISKVNEFAKRIVIYHNLPVYLEEGKIISGEVLGCRLSFSPGYISFCNHSHVSNIYS